MSHHFYVTPEQYERAARIGVSAANVNQRVRAYGWDPERAVTTPLVRGRDWGILLTLAEKNGIGYGTFMSRVHILGWDAKRAATKPLQNRKYPCKYTELARKNGISRQTFGARVKRGWGIDRAATEPLHPTLGRPRKHGRNRE